MRFRFTHTAIAAVLAISTLGILADTASSQAPRPRSDRTFEFGEGRALPFYVARSGTPTDRFRYYRRGWWYEEPWWMGTQPRGGIVGLRAFGSGPIADPYPVDQQNFSARKPIGF